MAPPTIDAITRIHERNNRMMRRVLSAMATPAGWRYCQPGRYSKNRAYAEAWVALRNKWVAALRQIDSAIGPENLPYDDDSLLFHKGEFFNAFKWGDYTIRLAKSDFDVSNWQSKRLYVGWNTRTQAFMLL